MAALRIAIVSAVPSHPLNAGNRVRIWSLAEGFQRAGHCVHLVHIRRWKGDAAAMAAYWGDRLHMVPYLRGNVPALRRSARIRRAAEGVLGLSNQKPLAIDDWYDDTANAELAALQAEFDFDVVVVVYVFFSRALAAFGGNVAKVIETQDVFSFRQRTLFGKGKERPFFSTTPAEESQGLNRADIVVAIQEEEATVLRSLCDAQVLTVGHPVPVRPAPESTDHPHLLFLGSDNPANVDGVHWLLDHVMPKVRDRFPDAQLLLAGNICREIGDNADCKRLGYLQKIEDAYRRAAVVVPAVRFGTGLKIKVVEALAHGKPVVTTTLGAAGLRTAAGRGLFIADESEEYAKRVIQLIGDVENRRKMSAEAIRFAEEYNATCSRQLDALLSEAEGHVSSTARGRHRP